MLIVFIMGFGFGLLTMWLDTKVVSYLSSVEKEKEKESSNG